MPPDFAPMIVATVLILTIGFVAVIRPISKPLIRLFEAMIREREQLPARELADLHRSLEAIGERLELLEERQSFYEALQAERVAPELANPRAPSASSASSAPAAASP